MSDVNRIVLRAAFVDECLKEVAYFSQQSEAVGRRFLAALRQSIESVVRMPLIGSPFPMSSRRLRSVRFSSIRGFRKHLIFYKATRGGIEFLHLFHGSRDYDVSA